MKYCVLYIIGEREQANLVVQLARFSVYISICRRVVFPDYTILRRLYRKSLDSSGNVEESKLVDLV